MPSYDSNQELSAQIDCIFDERVLIKRIVIAAIEKENQNLRLCHYHDFQNVRHL